MNTQSNHDAAGAEDLEALRIDAAIANPDMAQAVTLFGILRHAGETELGRRLALADLNSVDAFRRQVPPGALHTHRSMLSAEAASGEALLTPGPVALRVWHGKDRLPITGPDWQARRGLAAATLDRLADAHDFQTDRVVNLLGLSDRADLAALLPEVSDDPDLARIPDAEVRLYVSLLLALTRTDVEAMVLPDPGWLDRIEALLRRDGAHMLTDLEGLTLHVHERLSGSLARAIRARLQPDTRDLARQFLILRDRGALGLRDVFPHLRHIIVAEGPTDGTADTYSFHTLGCFRAEAALGTAWRDGAIMPALLDVFMEFVPVEGRAPVLLHQVETDQTYWVMVTTRSGLYRCRLDQRVRVAGWQGPCPLFTFETAVSGAAGAPAIETGAALTAVQGVLAEQGAPRPFARLIRRPDGGVTVIAHAETLHALSGAELGSAIDERLQAASYRYARLRSLGRIAPVAITASPCRPAEPAASQSSAA